MIPKQPADRRCEGSCNAIVQKFDGPGNHLGGFSAWEGLPYAAERMLKMCVLPGLERGWTYIDNSLCSTLEIKLAHKSQARITTLGSLSTAPTANSRSSPLPNRTSTSTTRETLCAPRQAASAHHHGGTPKLKAIVRQADSILIIPSALPCTWHTDCDYNNNYLCASDKDISLSST